MSSTASLQLLLNPAPVKVSGLSSMDFSAPAQPPVQQDFGQQYQQTLKQWREPAKNLHTGTSHPAVSGQGNSGEGHARLPDGRETVRVQRLSSPEKAANLEGGKELPLTGETLPLSAAAQEMLAALPADQRETLLHSLQQFLQQLDPSALQQFLAQLQTGDWQQALPDQLQQLMAGLSLDMAAQQTLLHSIAQSVAQITGFQQQAGQLHFDGEQLHWLTQVRATTPSANAVQGERAAILPEVPGKGLLAEDSSNRQTGQVQSGTEPLTARGATTETGQGRSDSQQQPQQQERIDQLIARLGRAEVTETAAGKLQEGIQQLIQSASQGLQTLSPVMQAMAARQIPAGMQMGNMAQITAQMNADALNQRIQVMRSQGMQIAEMRLDPPDLGSLRIQVKVQGEQTSILFHSANPQARELLEQAMPRLREMMEGSGLQLADAQVSREDFSDEGTQEQHPGGSSGRSAGTAESDHAEKDAVAVFDQPLTLVDYYA